MATQLTTVAVFIRKGIRYMIYASIILLILRVTWKVGLGIYRNSVPQKTAPPSIGFGPVPPIDFPDLGIDLPDLTYEIQTADNSLPQFPVQMPVYVMPKPVGKLFQTEKMIAKARRFGFAGEPIQISPRLYRFNHQEVPSVLEIDEVSGIFSITYNLSADPTPLLFRSKTAQEAVQLIRAKLNNAEIFPSDFEDAPVETTYLKKEGQNLPIALSLSDAELVLVSMFRAPFVYQEVEYPVVVPNPDEANVWFMVSGDDDTNKQIIAGEFNYREVDRTLAETYPIKNAEQALKDLADGKGFIAKRGANPENKIIIRRVYLAYYDPETQSDFMQPVIVFEGDNQFKAYVPALTDENIQREE